MAVSAGNRSPAPIQVSICGPAIGIAPHVYNNQEDVSRLLEVLQAALKTR